MNDSKGPNKSSIVVVVAGTEEVVSYNVNEPLKNVVNRALADSGNAGRKQEDWQLKYNGVEITDWTKKVGEYGFPTDAVLYLSLREGVLG